MAKKRNDGTKGPPTRNPDGTFPKGSSGNPSGIRKDAKPARRLDTWQNAFTGQGIFGRDKRLGASYSPDILSWDQLQMLWRGDDLIARAVETFPKEALRQGYDILISEDEDGGDAKTTTEREVEIEDKLETLGVDKILETALNFERGYGGGAILMGVNDAQTDLTQPLNLNKVKSIDWLTVLEPRDLMPIYGYTDPRAPKYGEPEIYRLNSRTVFPSSSGTYAQTTMDIHESRLLIFPGVRVSRYQMTSTQGGWGDSLMTRIWRVVADFNAAWAAAAILVSEAGQNVYKLKDLMETLAGDGAGAVAERLAWMEATRSTINGVVIDAEDEYARQNTPISGVPELLQQFQARLAAACGMPITVLFGTSPAGLNATGASDIRLFYDKVASYQARSILPQLKQLIRIVMLTTGDRQEPAKWNVRFRPLWQESTADRAKAFLTLMQADAMAIGAGVYSAEEAAHAHWGSGEFSPDISIDFGAREKQEQVVQTPVRPDITDPNHPGYTPPPPPGGGAPAPQSPDVAGNKPPSPPDPNTPPETPPGVTQDHYDAARARRKKQSDARRKRAGDDKNYTPPPGPGSLKETPRITPPDPRPAAPDPNTPPLDPAGFSTDALPGESVARKNRPTKKGAAAPPALGLTSDALGDTYERPRDHDDTTDALGMKLDADWDESQHPRDEGGKFGEGGGGLHEVTSGELVHKIAQSEAAGRGAGFTYDPHTGTFPDRGYSVSVNIEHEHRSPGKDVTGQEMTDYMASKKDLLEKTGRQVGGWYDVDHDQFVLDVVEVHADRANAARLGRENQQQAIYDLKRGEQINDHEYEDAIHGRGKFAQASHQDSAPERDADVRVRSEEDDGGRDGHGDARDPSEGARGARSPGGLTQLVRSEALGPDTIRSYVRRNAEFSRPGAVIGASYDKDAKVWSLEVGES